ncbi:MAG: hypothetical protein JJE09_02765 [Bacteroidia bacterium]|nr:hypothetical protein [Bacteroidia bacterium]
MKIRLSHKDYLLALGILVAVIVMLTTLVYTETLNPESKNDRPPVPGKTGLRVSPSVIIKKIVGDVNFKSLSHKNR